MSRDFPFADYHDDVAVARKRARHATFALGAMGVLSLARFGVVWWQRSELSAVVANPSLPRDALERADSVIQALAVPSLLGVIVTGVLFVNWLKSTMQLARTFGGTLAWYPAQVFKSFLIPVINWVRPYQMVCAVHDALSSQGLPEPEARPDEAGGYRTVAAAPEPVSIPHGSVGAWWACFWVANVLGQVSANYGNATVEAFMSGSYLASLSDVVDAVAAVLAIKVVHAVDARLAERHRRLAHNSIERLRASGVKLP